jgi:hypothetical protein
MVVLCQSRCACPLFSRNSVVLSRSGLVALQKYEACSDRHPDCGPGTVKRLAVQIPGQSFSNLLSVTQISSFG